MPPNAIFIADRWPLTKVQIGETIQQTGSRTVGRIHAAEGDFIYKTAPATRTHETLETELAANMLLPQLHFEHTPRLLLARDGRRCQRLDSTLLLYIQHCITGSTPTPNQQTYKKLGILTASLHHVKGYPLRSPFEPAAIIKDDLPSLTVDMACHTRYNKLIKTLPSFEGLPQALIHTDISPTNTIEQPDGELILVDLDDLGNGPKILDVAFPLIQQFVTEDCVYDESSAVAFYSAYLSSQELSPQELDLLFPAALFISMMYIVYGSPAKRWQRIQWALRHRALLERSIRVDS